MDTTSVAVEIHYTDGAPVQIDVDVPAGLYADDVIDAARRAARTWSRIHYPRSPIRHIAVEYDTAPR